MSHRLPFLALLATAFTLVTGSAWARCSQNVAGLERLGIQVASLEGLPFAAGNSPSRAIITFLGHSSYQIDTPQGVRAITDYNGVNGFGRKPDIVTMNNAHSTHFTDDPEEGITYVLNGWPSKPGEQIMMMHLEVLVDDLAAGCAHAQACGAVLAAYQPQETVRVHLDPDGHPFCIYIDNE